MMVYLCLTMRTPLLIHRLALVWSPGQPLLGRPTCSTRSHPHTPPNCASQSADSSTLALPLPLPPPPAAPRAASGGAPPPPAPSAAARATQPQKVRYQPFATIKLLFRVRVRAQHEECTRTFVISHTPALTHSPESKTQPRGLATWSAVLHRMLTDFTQHVTYIQF